MLDTETKFYWIFRWTNWRNMLLPLFDLYFRNEATKTINRAIFTLYDKHEYSIRRIGQQFTTFRQRNVRNSIKTKTITCNAEKNQHEASYRMHTNPPLISTSGKSIPENDFCILGTLVLSSTLLIRVSVTWMLNQLLDCSSITSKKLFPLLLNRVIRFLIYISNSFLAIDWEAGSKEWLQMWK